MSGEESNPPDASGLGFKERLRGDAQACEAIAGRDQQASQAGGDVEYRHAIGKLPRPVVQRDFEDGMVSLARAD